ncbi:MAG TPA: ATP-binding cassette domain-containing protein [Jiangellaceae bacterium]|nr:ATP-binding cassette domain-containing protein [Jiangellaceae bacterium]
MRKDLEFDGLTKRFGGRTALGGCTFAVRPGRITGFLGPNGAGKTTAMRAVFGLVRPDDGVVRWHGRPVGKADRLRFGYLPEERGVYPKMRVRDQLVYFGRLSGLSRTAAGGAADQWLGRLGLGERTRDRVEALSHGNQQRFQLAIALVNDPELLVLDEPFSGLDPLAVDTMMVLLRERAAAGVAVLFSSHQLDLVEDLCEDVVIIDHGRVVLSGRVDALRTKAAHRTLSLTVRSADTGWLPTVPGVEVLSVDDGTVRLRVQREADVADIVRLAAQAGDLTAVSFQPPELSELFRQAVRT